MEKNKTIAQQLGITKFPFTIRDEKGREIYWENSQNQWKKRTYNSNDKLVRYESTNRWWISSYDDNGNETYYESSDGYWQKKEYDSKGREIYFVNSKGEIEDNRPKVVELSIEEIAKKLGIDSKLLKIVDK